MRNETKKYFSFVLLFLFLFPMVERELHAFEHSADKHCTANEKHFHDLEHHCDSCDLTISDSNESPEVYYQFILSISSFSFQSHIESVNIPASYQNLPPRAPPIV